MDNLADANVTRDCDAITECGENVPTPSKGEFNLDHLRDDRCKLALLPDKRRIELIRNGIVIEHPAFARALDHASWLLSHPGGSLGRGMLLMGDSGAGKTTFGDLLSGLFAADSGEGRIVMIDASGAKSMREIYGRVLQALDGPVGRSMHTPDRELAVIRLFRVLNVRALIVDEVQGIAEGNDKEQRRVLDGIKYLMNTARIPLICLGAPESERALVTDKHLAQRLPRFWLKPWQVDQDFLDFLTAVQTALPLRKPSELRDEAVLKFLIKATEGSLRRIMEIITNAAVQAILSGSECLTLDGLQNALAVPSRHDCAAIPDA